MSNINQPYTQKTYRWVILAVFGLISVTGTFAQYQVAALAYQIIPMYKLNSMQFASLISVPMLGTFLLSLGAGALADRFGVKQVVTAGAFISVAAAFLRVFANNYLGFLLCMLLMATVMSMQNANASKYLGMWFSKEQMGTAIGAFYVCNMLGISIGLATSALFPSVRSAFLAAAFIMLGAALLWLILAKNKPAGAPELPVMPVLRYVKVAARSRVIWLAGATAGLYMAGSVAFNTFLPTALNVVKQADPVTAGAMAAALTLGNTIGSLLGPVLVDRIGLIKPVVIPFTIIGAVVLYFGWVAPVGTIMSVCLFIGGLFAGGSLPIALSFPMRLKEIGPTYAGSAGGIISMLQMAGAFFIPTFILAPMAEINYGFIFLASVLLIFAVVIVYIFIPEVGLKAQSGRQHSQITSSD
ncbi:MAG: MFS transporter [Peptococcaceae bacterium]|nr:MFS transporter [Peptococcaceae bacterium]